MNRLGPRGSPDRYRPRGSVGAGVFDGGMAHDPNTLPDDLPAPADDGAADHLPGTVMPALSLPSTQGGAQRLDRVPGGAARLVLYAYPRTGVPGQDNPPGWDAIPGARGCTPESCGFRDHAADLAALGAAVAGVSTQDTAYQAEAATRLGLPFPLLADEALELTRALRLPTFEASGMTLLKRLTLVLRAGPDGGGAVVEHVFYPVFPPDTHAEQVLAWLREQSGA
ncbi:MAG: redoxin family protein [Streptosporangiales bacterium]|nr:redoxin family protein [Streptosporangiales bacterium]